MFLAQLPRLALLTLLVPLTACDPTDGKDDTGADGSLTGEGGDEACADVTCADGEDCVEGICVGSGALRFSLIWDASGDLDLYVTTPEGSTIYYSAPSADGGELDIDNTTGGEGSVENVFFETPASGEYSVYVDCYSCSDGTDYTIEIAENGNPVGGESGTLNSGDESTPITHAY